MARKVKYEMTYNSDHYTCAANDIIRGKQEMTVQTARLIRLLVTQVVKEDKDLKTYICKVSDLANFLGIAPNNLYRDIREICKCAIQSLVYIGTENPKEPWKMFHWISTAEYDGNGTLTLKLSEEIKPYVLELDKYFTQYQLKNILQFQSYYSIRLYELIKCEDGRTGHEKSFLSFDFSELRKSFDCENKYPRSFDFKRRTIDIAVREINEKSDIYIQPIFKKSGRTVSSVEFEIHPNIYKNKK